MNILHFKMKKPTKSHIHTKYIQTLNLSYILQINKTRKIANIYFQIMVQFQC